MLTFIAYISQHFIRSWQIIFMNQSQIDDGSVPRLYYAKQAYNHGGRVQRDPTIRANMRIVYKTRVSAITLSLHVSATL